MAETNGNQDTRTEWIEKALKTMLADHEQFRQEHKQLLIAQVVQSEQIANLLKVTQEQSRQFEAQGEKNAVFDERVDKLVSAIGRFIERLPASPA